MCQFEAKADESKNFRWTLRHAYYASMGGFVIDVDHDPSKEDQLFANLNNKVQRLTLTPRGIDLLGQCGLLPAISEEEIWDKSKEDGLGKTIACLQAGWLIVNLICRLVLRIPITLLEVNTLGHVLCAFLIYGMWWYKPRWVTEPTRLEGDWVGPLGAFMFMSSKMSHQDDDEGKGILRDFGLHAELSHLAFTPLRDDGLGSEISSDSCIGDPQQQKTSGEDPIFEMGRNGTFGPRPKYMATDSSKDPGQVEKAVQSSPSAHTFAADATTLRRWDLAAQAISQYPTISKLLEKPLDKESRMYVNAIRTYPEIPSRFKNTDERRPSMKPISDTWFECVSEQYVTDAESNWPSDDLYKDMGGLVMGSLLWFASIGYSAVHLTAWQSDFPSVFEQWMWRASALYIGFSGILWLAIIALAQASSTVWWYWYDLLTRQGAKSLAYVVLGFLCGICGMLYMASRVFIVVEAFISLRSLKVGAYLAPEWVVSVPHL
ncbi:MAG: hypothetical protein M1831_000656 [Alyxoria varia]|nr:MAG: hypothetical protein M1831_000656 [Alyxoria varia]